MLLIFRRWLRDPTFFLHLKFPGLLLLLPLTKSPAWSAGPGSCESFPGGQAVLPSVVTFCQLTLKPCCFPPALAPRSLLGASLLGSSLITTGVPGVVCKLQRWAAGTQGSSDQGPPTHTCWALAVLPAPQLPWDQHSRWLSYKSLSFIYQLFQRVTLNGSYERKPSIPRLKWNITVTLVLSHCTCRPRPGPCLWP